MSAAEAGTCAACRYWTQTAGWSWYGTCELLRLCRRAGGTSSQAAAQLELTLLYDGQVWTSRSERCKHGYEPRTT